MEKNIERLELKCRMQFEEIRRLRKDVEKAREGVRQVEAAADALLISVARQYGAPQEDGETVVLKLDRVDVETVMGKYDAEVDAHGVRGDGFFLIRVAPKKKQGEKDEGTEGS